MLKKLLSLLSVLILSSSSQASAQTFGVGDPAPRLRLAHFVKGKPLSAFEPGKTYVVEFWTTWCGPCVGEHAPPLQTAMELPRRWRTPQYDHLSVDVEDTYGA